MDLKSSEPFWLIKNGLLNSYPSLKESRSCEVLVVGAGITGSLVAHALCREGYKVILIDRREVATGSTSATTSMLQYEIDVPLFQLKEKIGDRGAVASYRGCSNSIDALEEICKLIGSKAGFQRKDSLYFAAFKKDRRWLIKEYESRVDAGFSVEWLEGEQIKSRFGFVGTHGGILSRQAASVDAFRLTHELLVDAAKKGLEVFDRCELLKVKKGKDGLRAELSGGHTIEADKIIYCTGFESTEKISKNIVDLKSTYAFVSEISPQRVGKLKDTLIWNTESPYLYLRTTEEGRLLVGGKDESFTSAKRRDKIKDEKANELFKSLEKWAPGLCPSIDFSWAGSFGETEDGLPYIGQDPKEKNAYWVLGFGGNGITFSVSAREMVLNWLKGQSHPLEPYYSFSR